MEHVLSNIQRIIQPSESAFAALRDALKPRKLDKNEYFLKEGKICNTIGFVEQGSFRLFYNTSKKEVCKGFLFENDIIGSLASFLSKTPSRVNISAIEPSLVLEMDYDALFRLTNNFVEWKKLAKIIVEDQLLRFEHREASLLKDAPEVRFRKLMEEHPKIFKRIPLQDIASYLAITAETLSRYRSKLKGD
jgi:CRP-like cAMP-binding protein